MTDKAIDNEALLGSFKPAVLEPAHPAIQQAIDMVTDTQIQDHPFFEIAQKSQTSLRYWVSQEVQISNPFSIELLKLASRIENVHIRCMVWQVTQGEHGLVRKGVAAKAHPYIIYELCRDLDVDLENVTIFEETDRFLRWIREECAGPILAGIAGLGVGSEQLIITEYAAVKDAFEAAWPDSPYAAFFDANLKEDIAHGPLMSNAAQALIKTDEDAQIYLDAARRSIDERIYFYDAMAERCRGL